MYGKSGQAVQVSASDEVVLSADDQDATDFMLVGCRAWDNVPESLRPQCYSLVEAASPGWYVRQYSYFLRVDPEYNQANVTLFAMDASFILHTDTFYPGYYALESVNFPNHYIQSDADGRLWIAQRLDTVEYNNTASFTIPDYRPSGK